MESRKVQRVGYSTFSVSLPKEWARESGLKQGDLVMLFPEKDGSLKIMPSRMVETRTPTEEYIIDSDLCNEPRMLERLIVGNYTLGRDAFKVVSSTRIRREHIEEIREIAHRLMGLGIVQEKPEQIDLQCSIDPTKFKIDLLIRRLSVIASTMHTEAMQGLVDSSQQLAEDAIRREIEADMMYWLAIRLLISAQRDRSIADKIGLDEPSQILYYALITRYLEQIADHAENIARRAIEFHSEFNAVTGIEFHAVTGMKTSKNLMSQILNLSELTHTILIKAVDCLFSGDIQIANTVLEMNKLIRREREKLRKELPEFPILRTVLLELSRIAENGAGIAVIAVNRALEKPSKICSVKVY